jgi:hypothetical protein
VSGRVGERSRQRLAGTDTDEDLLAISDAHAARPRVPLVWHSSGEPAIANHETDHRRGAADLSCHVHKPPAARSKTERELLLLVREDPGHDAAPVIEGLGIVIGPLRPPVDSAEHFLP